MAGKFDLKYGVYKGDKEDGAHKSDPDGGRYDFLSGDKVIERFLIKRDTKSGQNDIAEYLAASIFQQTAPGYGAEIELAQNTSPDPNNRANRNAFLSSKFFKQGYRDFFKDNTYVFSKRTGVLAALESASLKSPKSDLKRKSEGAYEYSGYEKAMVTSLLVGDFSVHSGNIGVIDIESGKGEKPKKQLVRIDFGAAFRDFTNDINPYQSIKNSKGYEKNYFLRDHPKERTMTKAFADELRRVADIDLTPLVEVKWGEIEKNFDPKTIQAFAKQIKVPGADIGEVDSQQIKSHFAETIKKRQQSLTNMACEIDIKLALKGKKVDMAKLQEAIVRNPEHVERILNTQSSELRISLKENEVYILKAATISLLLKEQPDISIHRDIEKARSYFDRILKLKEQKNLEAREQAIKEQRKPPDLIDFSQYAALQKQWHEFFDKAAKNLSNESNIDPEYKRKIGQCITVMTSSVNFPQGWAKNIPKYGQNLTDAVTEAVKASSMPIDYNKFDLTTAADSGGVTRSKRVKMDGKNYQLKPSIKDNVFERRAKANLTDRENYGEVISSKIARRLLITDSFEATPNVSLVYDKVRERTLVASKYLEGDKVRSILPSKYYLAGDKVRTLDVFIQIKTGFELKGEEHIKFVDGRRKEGRANPNKGEYNIGGPENSALRKDIAKGIAGSIINGDHDINPGNFVVVTKDGIDRVARINFGHAFNDLLNSSKVSGGAVRNKDNQVLDFLNRESIAGPKFGAQSKLWRDYPGMIPTQEMADAFKEVSQSVELNQGIADGKAEFAALLKAMKRNGDEKGIEHLKKSLDAISSNISGVKLGPKLGPEDTIDAAFDNIEKFAKDNQKKMASVGALMQLQVDIDKTIEGKKEGIEPSKEQIDQIKAAYAELKQAKGIGQKGDGLEWVKTSASKAAHKGNLESYITEREKQLGLNKQLKKELVLKGEVTTPPPLLSRSGDAIALSGHPVEREVKNTGTKLSESGQVVLPTTSGKTQTNSVIDIIIRQEVISKQAEILKNAVASIHPEVDKLSTKEFQKHLAKPGNKQKVEQAFENSVVKEDLEKAIQKAEIAGYKKFNEEFAKVAKPIAWDSHSSKANEKLQIVKNKAGEEICTLTEKTMKLSRTNTLPNGTTKEQEVSARTIEFPPSIKEGSGPMHASFALKDEHGQNMPAEGAVYFTAHYDKSGKLTEVSSPQPVKFMGSNPETAVGYIERNGQIYTLPVTQKTYENMMKQTVDLARQEDVAKDHVIVTAVESPTKAKLSYSLEEVSERLKDKTSAQVVEILKKRVLDGNRELVGLIVEATKPGRVGDHAGVPQLTAEQFKQVYDVGMKSAKAIGDKPPKSKALNMTEQLKLSGIQGACGKLAPAANIQAAVHLKITGVNVKNFNTKQHGFVV